VPDRADAPLYRLTINEPGYDVTVTEVERQPRYSLLETKGIVPTITAGGVVSSRASYDIARQRGFEYTFSLPIGPTVNSRGPEGRRLFSRVKLYLTNEPATSLSALLGSDYSAQAQRQFDATGYLSVKQMAALFGR
jgi:hypothetical protein